LRKTTEKQYFIDRFRYSIGFLLKTFLTMRT
jgi:hypothetical protein